MTHLVSLVWFLVLRTRQASEIQDVFLIQSLPLVRRISDTLFGSVKSSIKFCHIRGLIERYRRLWRFWWKRISLGERSRRFEGRSDLPFYWLRLWHTPSE